MAPNLLLSFQGSNQAIKEKDLWDSSKPSCVTACSGMYFLFRVCYFFLITKQGRVKGGNVCIIRLKKNLNHGFLPSVIEAPSTAMPVHLALLLLLLCILFLLLSCVFYFFIDLFNLSFIFSSEWKKVHTIKFHCSCS